jgi:hypothetical protein
MDGEPLIIPLRVPARYRRTFPPISVGVVVGCVQWMALDGWVEALLIGGRRSADPDE